VRRPRGLAAASVGDDASGAVSGGTP
jgi:hypothetical protein